MTYALRKLLRALVSVFLIVTAVFFLVRLAGDPVLAILGPDEFSEATLREFRAYLGIDKPAWEQYLGFLGNAARGDMGRSFIENRSAFSVVAERLPVTLSLMLASLTVSLIIGLPCGIAAALNHNRGADAVVSTGALVFQAIPNFVLGVALMLVFAVWLRWLPAGGSGSWRQLIMPALTFGTSGAAVFARFTRSAMLEALRQPYVVAAKARGIPWRRIVLLHVLPNAGLPLLTILGFTVGALVAGSIVVETIFAWPGIGRLTATAVHHRDLPVVQVIVLFVMTAMVTTNLIVDLSYAWIDPRIRLKGGRA